MLIEVDATDPTHGAHRVFHPAVLRALVDLRPTYTIPGGIVRVRIRVSAPTHEIATEVVERIFDTAHHDAIRIAGVTATNA